MLRDRCLAVHKVHLPLCVGDQGPAHGSKVLVGRNDTKETSDVLQEGLKSDLTDVVVAKLRVCFRCYGPEVFPLILLPEDADKAGLDLLGQARKL